MSGKSTYFQAIVKEGSDAHCAGTPKGMNPYRIGNAAEQPARRHKKFSSWAHGWNVASDEHGRQIFADRNRVATLQRAGIE